MMAKPYLHQQADWPNLHWRDGELIGLLASVRHQQGRLLGRMENWGFAVRQAVSAATLTDDVVHSSAIEGERLDSAQVRSSIARRLGIDNGGIKPLPAGDDGIVAMMLDATGNYLDPLTDARLLEWHRGLFPTGRSNMRDIKVGGWRDDASDPMQVVSGPIGRKKAHFEAPPAAVADREMQTFLEWFNAPPQIDPVLKAGMAHLWLVTVHPFEDGNGRIARAIADLLLARADDSRLRFYSMSSQIRLERKAYYRVLETTQKGTSDITRWMDWFLACLGRSIVDTQDNFDAVIAKAIFWAGLSDHALNSRQNNLINRLYDGFEGKLTQTKWAQIAKCSLDEARRDIADLIAKDVLVPSPAGGREPGYHLVYDGKAEPRQ